MCQKGQLELQKGEQCLITMYIFFRFEVIPGQAMDFQIFDCIFCIVLEN